MLWCTKIWCIDRSIAATRAVAYLGGACSHGLPLGTSEKIFWRDTVKNGISNLQYNIFCSNVHSKCRKCRFRAPKFKTSPGDHAPGAPYNCVFTMASPSLKSWLCYWTRVYSTHDFVAWQCLRWVPDYIYIYISTVTRTVYTYYSSSY